MPRKATLTKKKVTDAAKPTLTTFVFGKKTAGTTPVPLYLTRRFSPELIAQALHTLEKRTRIRRAHTKDRSEVRGGGKKPWKQKGTGRARHASIRSPIWVGGGTVFGPRSRKTRVLPMPLTMRRQAFAAALHEYARAEKLRVVTFEAALPTKTKEFVAQLPTAARGVLIIIAPVHEALRRVTNNLPGVAVVTANQATILDVVGATEIWIDAAALPIIESRCTTKTTTPHTLPPTP